MGATIGLLNVRRSALIQASPARVWRECTSFEALKSWFGIGHTLHKFEPREGGEVDLSVEIDGERRHFGGRVLIFDGPRELTIESNWAPPHAWPAPSLMTIRLTSLYEATLVEIFHHGFERFADAGSELEGYEQGWTNNHLRALRALIEG